MFFRKSITEVKAVAYSPGSKWARSVLGVSRLQADDPSGGYWYSFRQSARAETAKQAPEIIDDATSVFVNGW